MKSRIKIVKSDVLDVKKVKMSIKYKLLSLFIVAMSILIVMNIVGLINEKSYIDQYDKLNEKLSIETSFNSQAEQAKGAVGVLSSTLGKDEEALKTYNNIKKDMIASLIYLDKNVTDKASKNELIGLKFVVESFLKNGDAAIKYAVENEPVKSQTSYTEFIQTTNFVKESATSLIKPETLQAKSVRQQISDSYKNNLLITIILLILITLISLSVVVIMTSRMIKPLKSIVNKSIMITNGDLTSGDSIIGTHDELSMLGEAFNAMQKSLANMVKDMKDSASIVMKAAQQMSAATNENSLSNNEVAEAVQKVSEMMSRQAENTNNMALSIEMLDYNIENISQKVLKVYERIDKAMNVAKKNLVSGSEADIAKFIDKADVASYAKQSVTTLVKNEIVSGDDGKINPLGNATRAETAVLIYKIYNK